MYLAHQYGSQGLMQSAELNSLLSRLDAHWDQMDAALTDGDAEQADILLREIRCLSREIDNLRIRNRPRFRSPGGFAA